MNYERLEKEEIIRIFKEETCETCRRYGIDAFCGGKSGIGCNEIIAGWLNEAEGEERMKSCENCDHAEVCAIKDNADHKCRYWDGWRHVEDELPPLCARVLVRDAARNICIDWLDMFNSDAKAWKMGTNAIEWRPLPKGAEE